MKLFISTKAIFYFIIVVPSFLIVSCSSSRPTGATGIPGEVHQIGIPQGCSGPEYASSNGFIRANAYGESSDRSMSRKIAKSNALAELASKIEVSVNVVVENYTKSSSLNLTENIETIYTELISQTVNQNIRGYKVICEKVIKTSDGRYRTYLTYEIPVDNIINPVFDNLSENDELKFKYDYQKFKQTVEEEIIKVDNQ